MNKKTFWSGLLLVGALGAVALAPLTGSARKHKHEWSCPTYDRNCDCPGGHTGKKTCVKCSCDTCTKSNDEECAGCNCS